MLLGKAARTNSPELEDFEDVTFKKSLSHMETVARLFSAAMIKETFTDMILRHKWTWQERNLAVGDVGFISYPSKLSRPWFRGQT